MSKRKIGIIIFISFLFIYIASVIVLPHYLSQAGLCVIGYHGVVSDEEKRTLYEEDPYTLSLTQFTSQMQYLYEQGYTTYSMEEVEAYYDGKMELKDKAIVLTFDDGFQNFNTYVKPVLEEYEFKGTCFVIGKHVQDKNDKFLKIEDMKNTDLISYYSHSHDLHRKSKQGVDRKIIEDLTPQEIDEDFKKDIVDDTYFAFPYGRSREGIDSILQENKVRLAFSYNQFKHMERSDSRYYLPRYMIVSAMPKWYFTWVV